MIVPNKRLRIYIIAGQSQNMGVGKLSDWPATRPINGGDIWNLRLDDSWQNPAREPLHDFAGNVYPVLHHPRMTEVGVGPGLFFADDMLSAVPEQPIGLVPCAVGGSSIAQWQCPRGGGTPATDTMFGAMLARVRRAQQFGDIAGILFSQGERETTRKPLALSWPAGFTQFCFDARRLFGDPDLPIVYTQIGSVFGAQARQRPYWSLVQQLQKQIRIPRVAMVGISDLPIGPDGIHLTTDGQRVHGHRLFEAMYALQSS